MLYLHQNNISNTATLVYKVDVRVFTVLYTNTSLYAAYLAYLCNNIYFCLCMYENNLHFPTKIGKNYGQSV